MKSKRSSRKTYKRQRTPQRAAAAQPLSTRYEADVADGLEAIAAHEIAARLGGKARLDPVALRGMVRFTFTGAPPELFTLDTVLAVFQLHRFDVPRPRALLGDQNWRRLCAAADEILRWHLGGLFQTFYLSAAGAHTATMQRIAEGMARHLGLRRVQTPDEGHFLMRIRRPPEGGAGWDVLFRLTPRPLSARAWRVCNYPGALNATVAHAMALMTSPHREDVVFNPCCGSGTLLIERARAAPAARFIGCDIAASALECARQNASAAGMENMFQLEAWDACQTPLPDKNVDVILSDLPFGGLVGSHTENEQLYPALMQELARVARPGARCALITHEVRLLNAVLDAQEAWRIEQVIKVSLGGLHPRIFLLRRAEW